MIPYFFASGHWNYARDSIVYLRTMEKLPNSLMDKFIRGEHVVYLKDGLFNGVWSDMAIESTYMKVGKGLDGIVGVTTNKRSLAIWSNSHHLCGQVLTEIKDISSKKMQVDSNVHKEESVSRIKSDEVDRCNIKSLLNYASIL